MSEKYEEVRTIYESAASLVVLVRHRSLGHERIIKRIVKNSDGACVAGSVREALILLNLRHPNIPILYDLEEDEDYYYIVEEYIVGESMADYLYLHQSISHRELIRIAIELYDVLEYLHNLRTPICYQDMKLEHIYLSKGRIVLIDYGIATYLRDNEHSAYGTLSYVSREQLDGRCDTANDIYTTKVALRRIYDKSQQKRDLRIERLLNVSNNLSASEEKARWLAVSDRRSKERKHLDLSIAVLGNDTGVGVTHIAIALNCYLNSEGIVSIYKDLAGGGVVEKLLARDRSFSEKDNIIYHDCYKGIRTAGEAVADIILPIGLYVVDCGHNVSMARSCDACIYVVSSRPYKSNEIDDIASCDTTQVVINPGSVLVGVEIAAFLGRRVYSFPQDIDPFALSRVKSRVFRSIIDALQIM